MLSENPSTAALPDSCDARERAAIHRTISPLIIYAYTATLCSPAESTPSLLKHRVHPARVENAWRRPEAQIVHVLGDVEPPVHHACRDDDDVARLHDFLHDFVRHAAACWPVQVRRRVLASVDDVAVGEHRSTAGDDVVAFGLRIVSDAPGRPASWSSRHLAPAWRGGRSCGSAAPAGGCCVRRCPCGRNRDAIHCLSAMNDADGEILMADVDGFDVPIDSLSLTVDNVDLFLRDVSCRSWFRLPALSEYRDRTQNDGECDCAC